MYGDNLIIINEVGSEQSLYFQQLFELEHLLGWLPDRKRRVHVRHGLYRFKDRKMSTRKGDVIWLNDVLTEAFERAKEAAKTKVSDSDIWKIAIGAIKWNDLSKESSRDVNFNLDEILQLKGNSGPYMQYSFVRGWSILRKGRWVKNFDFNKKLISEFFSESSSQITSAEFSYSDLDEGELDLWRWLARFPSVVQRATEAYAPHHLANYLYELATRFNTFYAREVILGHKRREVLTWLVTEVIWTGLGLLGIEVVEKM
jgi:arginyl-tRNA synthetase